MTSPGNERTLAQPIRYLPFARHVVVCAAAGIALSGCAIHYTDSHGAERIIGLVNMRLDEPSTDGLDGSTFAGRVIDIQSLGVAVITTDAGTSVSIGYNRERSGYLRNHVLVRGNPLEISRHFRSAQ